MASWFCIWAEAPALVAARRGCRFPAHPYFGAPGDPSPPLGGVLALGSSPQLHANPLPGAWAPVPNNLLRRLRFGKAPASRLLVAGSAEAPGRQGKSLGSPTGERQTLATPCGAQCVSPPTASREPEVPCALPPLSHFAHPGDF